MIYFCSLNQGLVVQLVRMPPCHGGGREFESRPVRGIKKKSPVAYIVTGLFNKSVLTPGQSPEPGFRPRGGEFTGRD